METLTFVLDGTSHLKGPEVWAQHSRGPGFSNCTFLDDWIMCRRSVWVGNCVSHLKGSPCILTQKEIQSFPLPSLLETLQACDLGSCWRLGLTWVYLMTYAGQGQLFAQGGSPVGREFTARRRTFMWNQFHSFMDRPTLWEGISQSSKIRATAMRHFSKYGR